MIPTFLDYVLQAELADIDVQQITYVKQLQRCEPVPIHKQEHFWQGNIYTEFGADSGDFGYGTNELYTKLICNDSNHDTNSTYTFYYGIYTLNKGRG